MLSLMCRLLPSLISVHIPHFLLLVCFCFLKNLLNAAHKIVQALPATRASLSASATRKDFLLNLQVLFFFSFTPLAASRKVLRWAQGLRPFCWNKKLVSLAAMARSFPFIGVMKNSDYVSLLSLSLISPFLSTPSIRKSNQALEATCISFWALINISMSCEGMRCPNVFPR